MLGWSGDTVTINIHIKGGRAAIQAQSGEGSVPLDKLPVHHLE